MHSIEVIGRLGKDPECRFLSDGTQVTSFNLADNSKWTRKSGEKVEKSIKNGLGQKTED
jgi:single-strand DNA-binding protein